MGIIITQLKENQEGKTELAMSIQLIGEKPIADQGSFKSRANACAYVRSTVFSYFLHNLEKYYKNCRHFAELSGKRPDSLKVLKKFIDHLAENRAKQPNYLYDFFTINDHLKNCLPSKHYQKQREKLGLWLQAMDNLARDFYDERKNRPDNQMNHLIQAK